MKKVLSFILVLSMVLGSFGMAFAAPATTDIAGHKNEAAIERLNKLGIVKGDDRGFAPDANITRAEFAVMLVRALGLESSANLAKGDTQFTDVTVAAGYEWATGAINVANRLGYINGYGDGKFGPADQIRYEDAITMIVRALGYEPAAQAKGGYPVGYLVVAEQDLDLTDNTTVAAGTAATRGTVFQMLDNALTEDMMVQVGYGDKAEFEVKEGKTLLGQLGYKTLANNRVIDFDTDDLTITLRNDHVKASDSAYLTEAVLEVGEDFDFEASFGLKLTVWYDKNDVVIAYEAKDAAIFDGLEVTEDEVEIELNDADKEYDVHEDAVVFINGEEEAVTDLLEGDVYNYAKVVLNSKNEAMFINAYELNDFVVVEEVEDEVIFGYGDELDVEDFVIVKEGKTISAEDVVAGDILFYNNDAEYAEVFNKSVEGEIVDVFKGSFRVEKKDYNIANDIFTALYLDSETEDLDTLDEAVLEQMEDEGEAVEVFFSRTGAVVLVAGVRGEGVTTTVSGILTSDLVEYSSRATSYLAVDMVNNEGKEVSYDVKTSSVDVFDGATELTTIAADATLAYKGDVIEVEIDEDGKVEEIKILVSEGVKTEDVELDAKYIDAFRFKSNTVVYLLEGEYDITDLSDLDADDVVATTWANVEDFKELSKAVVYSDKGYVEYLVVSEADTDSDSDTEELTVLLTDIRYNTANTKVLRVTAFVDGAKVTYDVDSVEVAGLAKKDVVILHVDEDGVVQDITSATALEVTGLTIDELSTRDGEITVSGHVYELVSKASVYDATGTAKAINLRDIDPATYTVKVVLDNTKNDRMIQMIIVTGK